MTSLKTIIFSLAFITIFIPIVVAQAGSGKAFSEGFRHAELYKKAVLKNVFLSYLLPIIGTVTFALYFVIPLYIIYKDMLTIYGVLILVLSLIIVRIIDHVIFLKPKEKYWNKTFPILAKSALGNINPINEKNSTYKLLYNTAFGEYNANASSQNLYQYKNIFLCDIEHSMGVGKRKKMIFKGHFSAFRCNTSFIKPLRISFNLMKKSHTKFNTSEFDKYFKITGGNIPQYFMNGLVAFYKRYKIKFEIAIYPDYIYIRFYTGDNLGTNRFMGMRKEMLTTLGTIMIIKELNQIVKKNLGIANYR